MWDVVVVGGGPAGSTAALAAKVARPDARVLLVDRAAFPRDKTCGDAIGPHTRAELEMLGCAGLFHEREAVARYRLRGPEGAEVAGVPPVTGHVVPREEFDARLVAAAVDAGVEVARRKVTDLQHEGDGVVLGGDLAARVVVAADGANSTVRRLVGVPAFPDRHVAVAVRGYAPAVAGRDELFLGWEHGGGLRYVWSFATGDGRLNAGYIAPSAGLRGGRRELVDNLRRLLPDVDVDPDTLRGHRLPLSTHRAALARGRVLFAGDAASLINPLTGEGIFYAVVSGRLAGEAAVTAPDPAADYRRAVRRRLSRHRRHTRVLSRLLDAPGAVDAAVRAAAAPHMFDFLIDVGLGAGTMKPRHAAAIVSSRLRHWRPRDP